MMCASGTTMPKLVVLQEVSGMTRREALSSTSTSIPSTEAASHEAVLQRLVLSCPDAQEAGSLLNSEVS